MVRVRSRRDMKLIWFQQLLLWASICGYTAETLRRGMARGADAVLTMMRAMSTDFQVRLLYDSHRWA